MKNRFTLPATVVLLAAPAAAFAQEGGAPHILLYSLGGGFLGGLIGAFLACWLCKRMSKPDNLTSTRR